jgi:hypothetical protein
MNGVSQYTVLPTRKKAPEQEKVLAESKKLKPKKNNMKKKWKSKKKLFLKKHGHQENVTREEAIDYNGSDFLQTGDAAMSDSMKLSKEEFRKSSFDDNQGGANCEFNVGLDHMRVVPGRESCCVGSSVTESA